MLKKCITCPVCNGTKKLLNNKSCTNCGGQTQFGISTGFTFINIENKPCIHSYVTKKISKNYIKYNCRYCSFEFSIDSGD